jgi:hypothetical protein
MSLFTFKTQLQSQLEQSAEEAVSRLKIDPACELALRALVTGGVERMETEGRLGVKDIAIARSNLKRFIDEMKVEAVFLGHADQLDYASFQAADRTIERRRHANPTTAALWPFWPNECVRPRT